MTPDEIYTAEISVVGAPTKTVTIAPQRTTVVRELVDVPIKAGPNEITITGFDANIDFDSLRVTGVGPATITDIQSTVILRGDRFEDVFIDDEPVDFPYTDPEDSDDDFGVDRSELDQVTAELKALKLKLAFPENDKITCTQSLAFLDTYGQSMDAKNVEVQKVADYIQLYQKERASLRDTYEKSLSLIEELQEEYKKLERKESRLRIAFEKAKDRAARPARKEKRAAQLKKRLQWTKDQLARQETRKFWNQNVGNVILHLDGLDGADANASGQDSSVSGTKPSMDETITLSLTYVTAHSRWTPRYDLMLHTPTSSGKLTYRAEYYNMSSETWKDATVILSTSQTNFGGVDEHIPSLLPWNVKLRKYEARLNLTSNTRSSKKMSHWNGAYQTSAETSSGAKVKNANNNLQAYADALNSMPPGRVRYCMQRNIQEPPLFGQNSPQAAIQAPPAPAPSLPPAFGQLRECGMLGSGAPPPINSNAKSNDVSDDDNDDDNDEMDEMDDDTSTVYGSAHNILAFKQSSRQDYGLTTTYNIPGLRTLPPSSNVRRHVIAEIELTSIVFSHVIIPKLKPAAFLKGRIVNTSTTPLLKGKAGLTVDDAFLGTATIPNCNPGVAFNLNLGVDPAVQVTYSKPKIKRATTGYFNKDDCAIFTRVCRINNTNSSPISLTVFDQVPVSEDDRVRVRLLEPRGLDKEGESAKMGADVCIDPKKARDWGKGTVYRNRDGEIKWVINLAKAAEIRLVLEYEAKIPSGLEVVGL